MRRFFILLTMVLIVGLVQTSEARKYALLIGVDDYKNVPKLECCVNDMRILKDALMKIGFKGDDIQMLVTGANNPKDLPTKENIEGEISNILEKAEPDDIVFIAFSGHGAQEGKISYFCPPDVIINNLPGTCVSINNMMELLDSKCKAKFKWMVVDACRNNPNQGAKAIGNKGFQVIPISQAGIVLFQSCSAGEQSWEDRANKNGYFTKNFVAALSGEADTNHDGNLMLVEVCSWTTTKTKEEVRSSLNESQIPLISGAFSADFALNHQASPAVMLPPEKRKAGERKVKTVNNVGFAFRWCPDGQFLMGSPIAEKGRDDDETQHEVTLSNGFWMLETEVTQKQWEAIMKTNPSNFKDENLPVENVTWDDCQEFCKKCNELGLPVQLPTEAQWEYACRAGTTGPYAGNLNDMAWYSSNSSKKTQFVGTKTPNAWGLFDMHGNVWEWLQDWYDVFPNDSETDPSGPSSGSQRVIRGGSWNNYAKECRSANRDKCDSTARNDLGFRVKVQLPGKADVSESEKPSQLNQFSEIGTKAGERLVKNVNGVEFAFRWCPPGKFWMGSSSETEDKRNSWDETQHHVTLTKGFWMLETEVTQKQWKAIMKTDPSSFKGDNLPVENVTWNECQEFCKKCTELGMPVQLPTEAQWEYACRAGTTGPYAGNLNNMAWFWVQTTYPAGTKMPNAWGLYDMHGNVWEWCQDGWRKYTDESVTDPVGPVPVNPDDNIECANRGGGWNNSDGYCRSACRKKYSINKGYYNLGFRVINPDEKFGE